MSEPAGGRRETPDVESASDAYARRFAGRVGAFFLEVQRRTTLDLLAPWPRARLLDVGGGHAQLAVPLVAAGFDVTVLGSEARCEERLRRSLAPGSYAFRRGDLLDLPFDAAGFEVVLAFRLLPHVRRWERLVAELCRVARHAVIVDYPDIRSVNVASERLFGLKRALEGDTRPYRCFRRGELGAAFAAHGFPAATFRPQFALPMVAHRALRSAALSGCLEAAARRVGLTRRLGSPVIARFAREPAPAPAATPF